jgi:hydroxymethylbilane synthase
MTTRGDQILDRTLSKVGGKGLFVKELEVAMAGAAPTWPCIRSRTCRWSCRKASLAAVLEREDPRRVRLQRLRLAGRAAAGAVVGTSSLRRHR